MHQFENDSKALIVKKDESKIVTHDRLDEVREEDKENRSVFLPSPRSFSC